MLSVLGWKDILRPIRDGYRHLFPSPDTGPTPEERRRQRKLDRLKGFEYFDTLEELVDWTETKSDPLQRSNTPLLPRSLAAENRNRRKANVLLCHDYSGNYHDYETIQYVGVAEEQYVCEYLQYVDTFIYFSHKLACIPPSSWVNVLHRNGVKALGTLLVEPQAKNIEKLLYHTIGAAGAVQDISFPMAKQLAVIAEHYGFDGWLVNIEKPFSDKEWDPQILAAFLRQLRSELASGKSLVWYDALTVSNKVDYQNGLTPKNLLFAKACGSTLTNYCWKEDDAWNTRFLAHQENLPSSQIFLGVDVWAQNPSSLTHPRITYPERGGGGTNTGIAVAKAAEVDLSIAVFAAAWTFEHFPGQGRAMEKVVWNGEDTPESLECSCGDASQRHPPNRRYPISRCAQPFSAGSESFFFTDFCKGFGRHTKMERELVYEGRDLHSQLASQSVLPLMGRPDVRTDGAEDVTSILSLCLEDVPGGACLVVEARSNTPTGGKAKGVHEQWLPLYQLNMRADASLYLRIVCKYLLRAPGAITSFYLRFSQGLRFLNVGEEDDMQTIKAIVALEADNEEHGRLQEIGIHFRVPHCLSGPRRIMEIREICIYPRSMVDYSQSCRIVNIEAKSCGEGETGHIRLSWKLNPVTGDDNYLTDVPYSKITGPCSYFVVNVDEVSLGRIYALECILGEALAARLRNEGAEVKVVGVGFDGRPIAGGNACLPLYC